MSYPEDCLLLFVVEDCVWSPWTDWDECSKTCGQGQQRRTREITAQAIDGGAECEPPFVDTQPCNLEECPPGELII